MTKMIQIRHVPDEVHRTLKVRAAKAGLSLSDYLRREVEEVARRPTLDEWLEELAADEPVSPAESAADAVRAEREGR
jgi:plasmid stability protein